MSIEEITRLGINELQTGGEEVITPESSKVVLELIV